MPKQKAVETATGMLAELLGDWRDAKHEEKLAQRKRRQIEEQLAPLISTDRHYEDGTMRFTAARGDSYAIDADVWAQIEDEVPDDIIRRKLEVDGPKFRALRALNPEAYRRAARAITAKPKKLSISMKPLEATSGA